MKYGRLDSDFTDWPPWRRLRDAGKDERDYRKLVTLYLAFWSKLVKQFDTRNPKAELFVSLKELGRFVVLRPRYVEAGLKELGALFDFQIYPVDGSQGLRRVVYPNFIRKQTPKVRRAAKGRSPTHTHHHAGAPLDG